jgi:hypothetical protein
LSDAARHIDFHQKALLSDQIGVGMAALLLGIYFGAPLAADVSLAIGDPTWPIGLQYDVSPDYLFFDVSQTRLFIVECKGTQGSRATSLEQIRRGTEQVPSIVFTNGRTPPSLIVATCLSRREIRILIIDPPDEEDFRPETLGEPEPISQREWKIRNDAEFMRTARLISEAKVLSFAGAYQEAAVKLESAHMLVNRTPRSLPGKPETIENEFGRFTGIRQRVGLKDRFNIEVVQALEVAVHDAFVADEPTRTDEALRAFQHRSATAKDHQTGQPVVAARENNGVVVRSAGPDGSLLEVRVSPP